MWSCRMRRAEQRNELAQRKFERNVVQSDEPAKLLADLFDLNFFFAFQNQLFDMATAPAWLGR